jgi:hypothetical protein
VEEEFRGAIGVMLYIERLKYLVLEKYSEFKAELNKF